MIFQTRRNTPAALTMLRGLQIIFFSLFSLCSLADNDLCPAPCLNSSHDIATAGFFTLSWNQANGNIELQESASEDFANAVTLYSGADHARVMSGKSDGDWFYRIRKSGGTWTNAVHVEVTHHSLERAYSFFLLGLALFAITTAMIFCNKE